MMHRERDDVLPSFFQTQLTGWETGDKYLRLDRFLL